MGGPRQEIGGVMFDLDYNQKQLQELEYGRLRGFPIDYLDPNRHDWYQMKQIRLGIESGHPIDDLNPYSFTGFEMLEIRLGRESGNLADIDPKKGA